MPQCCRRRFWERLEPDTVLSTLIARISPSSPPVWPHLTGTVNANALILGPVTLRNAHIAANLSQAGAEFTSVHAEFLGGTVQGTERSRAAPSRHTPSKETSRASMAPPSASFSRCNARAVSSPETARSNWQDSPIENSLHPQKARCTSNGGMGRLVQTPRSQIPKALTHFDRLVADATIANNGATIRQAQIALGTRKADLDATVTFADPPSVGFDEPNAAQSAKR